MPGLDTTAPNAGADDLDRMLDDSFDVDALFDDIERDAQARGQPTAAAPQKKQGADLGLDEQIEVKKARKPVPKLDENLLLTQKGIPKLRTLTGHKLKFKGKGHEFSDVARLLNMYQLWLDELHPRSKFADSIAMVEKAGHSKRMQVMRREWINESKPKDPFETADGPETAPAPQHQNGGAAFMAGALAPAPETDGQLPPQRDGSPGLFLSDDEGPAMEARKADAPPRAAGDEQPEEDELDALLAGSEPVVAPAASEPRAQQVPPPTDDFADEMEAMDGMDMW